GKRMNVSFTRTMTNVGTTTPTTYKPKITTSNDKITVTVEPKVLSFSSLNEKKRLLLCCKCYWTWIGGFI
ncbi:hypothetical protein MKX03_007399, partial [Papaver bracteatum]